MRVEDNYPTPIHGVSTLAPRNRANGRAGEQINLRSDPVNKLTRRPSLKWQHHLLDLVGDESILHHSYVRDDDTFRIFVDENSGDVFTFKNNEPKSVSLGALSTYVTAGTTSLRTVGDKTYVLNKSTKVALLPDINADYTKVSYVNITSALNYGETITIGIGSPGDSPLTTISYTIPDLGTTEPDYDTADKARATTEVANQIAIALNAQAWFSPTMTAQASGSSVAIYLNDNSAHVNVYITSGQGDRSSVPINQTIEQVDGLPLYAVHDSVITVQPNPVSAKGTYYLKAVRTAEPAVSPAGLYLEEVVWTETRNQLQPFSFDATTLPYVVEWDTDLADFTVSVGTWTERRTGDDDSVKVAEFVGYAIDDISLQHNRLMFISNGDAFLSETDKHENWWRKSAVQLLVSDTAHIGSAVVGANKIKHISNHNKDVLLIASNAQFKISGEQAITPQTISMPKVSSYECSVIIPPIQMGDNVLLPIQQGESVGLMEYTTRAATEQDRSDNLARHVVGYMKGVFKKMVGSVNSNIVAITTTDGGTDTLYIYEYTKKADTSIQNSWSKWVFPEDIDILDMTFVENKLTLVTKQDLRVIVQELDLYNRVTTKTDEVYLDYMLTELTDGNTLAIPDKYVMSQDTIIVRGFNCKYPLWQAKYDVVGNNIVFDETITAGGMCEVYIGKPFVSSYTPTRPYRRDETGIPITSDRLRVSRYVLNLVDTFEVTMTVTPKFSDTYDVAFNSRIMGSSSNIIGDRRAYTGDTKLSYGQEAEHADATFWTDSFLGMTVAGISWQGQYNKTYGRM